MRKRLSDRRLILLTVFALFVEVLLLLAHLNILPIFSTDSKDKIKAGYVLRTEKDLKKKVADGLMWDSVEKDDSVYFYDSLLTLSESSATLYLYEKTEISLSENTLVTIEPEDKDSQGQIRIKFSKGDLHARNPYSQTKIESEGTLLILEKGSEVNLRSQGENGVELEVLSGELKLSNGESISKNQLLQIKDKTVTSKKDILTDLDFLSRPKNRIYTHLEKEVLGFNWKNPEAQLEYWQFGTFDRKTINQGQQLSLNPGKYFYRLKLNDQVSSTFKLEIWKAPVIHLVSPLPRDRSPYNSNLEFIWTITTQAQKYQFELEDSKGKIIQSQSADNFVYQNLTTDADYNWRVYGYDQDGFAIPPLYSYPLYIRESPLAAPTIRKPLLRLPATAPKHPKHKEPSKTIRKKKVSLFELLWDAVIPSAKAESHAHATADAADWEAVFTWDKVAGAKHYIIEISETPDFRHPLLAQKIKSSQLVWNVKKLQKYYWRVAAGTDSRLGVFSEPELVDFSKIKPDSNQIDGLEVRRRRLPKKAVVSVTSTQNPTQEVVTLPEPIVVVQSPPAAEEPPAIKEPLVVKESPLAKEPPPIKDLPAKKPIARENPVREIKNWSRIDWTPEILAWTLNSDESVSASVDNMVLGNFSYTAERQKSEFDSVLYQGRLSMYNFAAKDKDKLPYQGNIKGFEYSFSYLHGSSKSYWYSGWNINSQSFVSRAEEEAIKMDSSIGVGYEFAYLNASFESSFLMTMGSGFYGIESENSWTLMQFGSNGSIGLAADVGYFMRGQNANTKINYGIRFGYEY